MRTSAWGHRRVPGELAELLADAGFEVSVVEPLLVEKYSASLGERRETVIARFFEERRPERP